MIQTVLYRKCLDISVAREDINRNSIGSHNIVTFRPYGEILLSVIFLFCFIHQLTYANDFHCHRIALLFIDRVAKM